MRGGVDSLKNTRQYQQYFCARQHRHAEQLKANQLERVELYKAAPAPARSPLA